LKFILFNSSLYIANVINENIGEERRDRKSSCVWTLKSIINEVEQEEKTDEMRELAARYCVEYDLDPGVVRAQFVSTLEKTSMRTFSKSSNEAEEEVKQLELLRQKIDYIVQNPPSLRYVFPRSAFESQANNNLIHHRKETPQSQIVVIEDDLSQVIQLF